jgi:hypothetical protein
MNWFELRHFRIYHIPSQDSLLSDSWVSRLLARQFPEEGSYKSSSAFKGFLMTEAAKQRLSEGIFKNKPFLPSIILKKMCHS